MPEPKKIFGQVINDQGVAEGDAWFHENGFGPSSPEEDLERMQTLENRRHERLAASLEASDPKAAAMIYRQLIDENPDHARLAFWRKKQKTVFQEDGGR